MLVRACYSALLRSAAAFDSNPLLKISLTRPSGTLSAPTEAVTVALFGTSSQFYVPTVSLKDVVRKLFREKQADTGAALDTALYFIRYINLRKKWLEQVNISRAECTAGGILPLATPDPTHASIVGDINPGCFLIAHPLLDDYFRRAVIFMLSHTTQGSIGIVINTANSKGPLKDFIKDADAQAQLSFEFGASPVWAGGPVPGTGYFLHVNPNISGAAQIGDSGVYGGGKLLEAFSSVNTGSTQFIDYKIYDGAAVWSKGQLQSEISRGVWIPVRCSNSWSILREGCGHNDVGTGVWHSLMVALGGEYAAMATAPLNATEHTPFPE